MFVIKDMEMPQNCQSCTFYNGLGCEATGRMFSLLYNVATRRSDCPLIEVPELHGRLIDEKDIVPKDGYIIADGMACIPVKDIANAPTAIPASGG